MVLSSNFFHRRTLTVARELLGRTLCRRLPDGRVIYGTITETEAYCGPHDLASHASRGKTPRTAVMFGPPGRIYVYLVYGMYWCLNIVTEREGYPAAVLIRAVTVPGVPQQQTNGPGKLCRFFHIDKSFNGKTLGQRTGLWIERPRAARRNFHIKKTPRIGVGYAGPYRAKPWRFSAQLPPPATRDAHRPHTAARSPRASGSA